MNTDQTREERNALLRDCVPGDQLVLECTDRRERSVEVVARIGKGREDIVLKAEGHGTTYQIDVPGPLYEAAVTRVRWPSGSAWVRTATRDRDGETIWSDTSASDVLEAIR